MPYAELHAKTNFSFLEGASHPDELVGRAAELGYAALAVTDRNSLAGVVRAHQAAKEAGLKLLVGAEITPEDAPPVVLWATDRAAYGRLARLITRGCRRAAKGQCRLTLDDVAQHAAGLLAGVNTEFGSRNSEVGNGGQPAHFPNSAFRIPNYREAFGDRCYLLAELHCGPDDQRKLDRLRELSRRSGVPLVAAGDVHYHVPERQALCDVLTAIRCGSTVATAGRGSLPMPSAICNRRRPWRRGSPARRKRSGGRWRLPSVAPFRSMSCVTSIRRSWPRRARRPPSTSPG